MQRLICVVEGGSETYIFKDYLGSKRIAIDKTGAFGEGYAYDALGKRIGTARFGIGTANYPRYFYTGQEFDGETGLHNFRARLYDDELFRFYAMDPASQYDSPYTFTGNSPLIYRDRDGKFAWFVPLIFAGMQLGADLVRNDFKMNLGQIGMSLLKGGVQGTFAAFGGITTPLGALGSSLSSQLPSASVNVGGVNLSISPSVMFGTDGLSFGYDLGASMQVGNLAVGGSIGGNFTSSSPISGLNGAPLRSSAFGGYNSRDLSILGSYSNYNMGPNGGEFNQSLGSVYVRSGDFSIAHSNDFFTDSGDKGRTAAIEVGYKDVVVGIDILTNDAGNQVETSRESDSRWGANPKQTYKNGEVYSSPLYVGIKSGGRMYKAGWDNPRFQDFMQNGWHVTGGPFGVFGKSPYFRKGDYNRGYFSYGNYNRFIH